MDGAPPTSIRSGLDPTGISHALVAYGVWGFAPIYWKLTADYPASELLAYRVLASLGVAICVIALTRRRADVSRVLRSKRAVAAVVLGSLLIGCNWLTFIYAVQSDQILATSLGYYINPLVNVLFGMLLLRERLTRAQGIAVALATVGVVYQTLDLGELPWISLVLATSFGLYGLVRKLAPAQPLAGFGLEALTLTPLALAYLAWLGWRGAETVPSAGIGMQLFIAGSGLLTAAPLVAFASAAKRLPLSTLGMFQYLAPTLALLLAIAFYGEVFDGGHAVSFGCVWMALGLYAWDGWQRSPHPPAPVDGAPAPVDRAAAGLYPVKLDEAPEVES